MLSCFDIFMPITQTPLRSMRSVYVRFAILRNIDNVDSLKKKSQVSNHRLVPLPNLTMTWKKGK